MSTLSLPCVVLYEKTRYALAYRSDARHVYIVKNVDGVYTSERTSHDAFDNTFTVCSEQCATGKTAPTVRHFVDVVNASPCCVTEEVYSILKEITMSTFVTKAGKVVVGNDVANAAIELTKDDTKDLKTAAEQVFGALSQRALAVFVTDALKLPKPLNRVKKGDQRVEAAIKAALDTAPAAVTKKPEPRLVQPSKPKTKAAGKADGEVKKTRSVKARIAEMFSKPKFTATLEELVKELGSIESTITTAISDCKNPKYAPGGVALNIKKNEEGAYHIPKK